MTRCHPWIGHGHALAASCSEVMEQREDSLPMQLNLPRTWTPSFLLEHKNLWLGDWYYEYE